MLYYYRLFQSSPVHGGRAHATVTAAHTLAAIVSILARPWRTGAPFRMSPPVIDFKFQSSPVHGGRAHMCSTCEARTLKSFNPRPSMADGRTVDFTPPSARPNRFQSSPVHGGRAHPSCCEPPSDGTRVSILARPWRTGAPFLL